MPAINPQKVKTEINQIFNTDSSSSEMVKKLHFLLDIYADRTYRPGKEAALPSTLKSFHVPKPLMRILASEIAAFSTSQPEQSMRLTDDLWQQPYVEMKQLAVAMLQSLPDEHIPFIFQTIENWVLQCKNKHMEIELSQSVLTQIHQRNPYALLLQTQKWVNSQHLSLQKFGFQILVDSIQSAPFDYLPILFKLISPFLYNCPTALRQSVVAVLKSLARRSAKETAYLLRAAYQENPYSGVSRLIKSTLDSFPPEIEQELSSLISST